MARPTGARGNLKKRPASLYPDQVDAIESLAGDETFAVNLRAVLDLGLFVLHTMKRRPLQTGAEVVEHRGHAYNFASDRSTFDRLHFHDAILAEFVLDLAGLIEGQRTYVGLPARAAWDKRLSRLRIHLEGQDDYIELEEAEGIPITTWLREHEEELELTFDEILSAGKPSPPVEVEEEPPHLDPLDAAKARSALSRMFFRILFLAHRCQARRTALGWSFSAPDEEALTPLFEIALDKSIRAEAKP